MLPGHSRQNHDGHASNAGISVDALKDREAEILCRITVLVTACRFPASIDLARLEVQVQKHGRPAGPFLPTLAYRLQCRVHIILDIPISLTLRAAEDSLG